mmetsp:Transcript_77293/g.224229  ORF Transcript_77293/g.224229 Transcript_77293/m.224229 type:complete len:202 (-) Transcript_77293:266-871(-)
MVLQLLPFADCRRHGCEGRRSLRPAVAAQELDRATQADGHTVAGGRESAACGRHADYGRRLRQDPPRILGLRVGPEGGGGRDGARLRRGAREGGELECHLDEVARALLHVPLLRVHSAQGPGLHGGLSARAHPRRRGPLRLLPVGRPLSRDLHADRSHEDGPRQVGLLSSNHGLDGPAPPRQGLRRPRHRQQHRCRGLCPG